MHAFFAWIGHAAAWLLGFAKAHPESAFAIALGSAFAESFVGISFLVPGTTILVGLGVVVQATGINPVPIWLGAAIGAILGDWISYWIGHHYKEHALAVWPVSRYRPQMDKALAFFRRWGVWAIFIGRFMGPFRATVPIVAGISQMKFWPFQIANITSAIVWSAALLMLGALGTAALGPVIFAWHWFAKEHVRWVVLAFALAGAVALAFWRLRRTARRA
ncbi:MAG TPA: DedA family protein [Rhizomicrobium sp.]|jgi:membrane protein DedA with SNARE-associated domain|nr:DedA family protein [Rhizomicrobium sp.]